MPARILLVDDLAFMRKALRDALEPAGYHITGEAENGRQGLFLYDKLKPDLVILDIVMPVLDGISTLEKLLRKDPSATVVMCSAIGEQSMIVRAAQLGAWDYVVKPFSQERLVAVVERALAQRENGK